MASLAETSASQPSTSKESTSKDPTPAICRTCEAPNCTKPASMVCPKCKKLGITPPFYFCSQQCFKASWPKHKSVHSEYKKQQARFKGVVSYQFKGPLRPHYISPQMQIPKSLEGVIKKPDYHQSEANPAGIYIYIPKVTFNLFHLSNIYLTNLLIKSSNQGIPYTEQMEARSSGIVEYTSEEELKHLRKAGRLGREVLDIAGNAIKPGVSGDDIDKIVFNACMERKCYPSPLNYHTFPKSVCVSPNEVICHGIPDRRPFVAGDIINIDVTVYTQEGYHADMNETFFCVDERGLDCMDKDSIRVVQCAYETLRSAINFCRPGKLYRDVGETITRTAKKYRCAVNKSYCGHGIGKLFHCRPNVPHYRKNKAKGVMKVGHVFTIEPMINLGMHDVSLFYPILCIWFSFCFPNVRMDCGLIIGQR